MAERLPGLPYNEDQSKTKAREALAANMAVNQAQLFTKDAPECAAALTRGLCAHFIQMGDTSLGYETKRQLLLSLVNVLWDETVEIYERNK